MSEQPKKINRELMLAVAKHIRQHPESFMMAHVMTTSLKSRPECNTVGCIAGWTIALGKKDAPKDIEKRVMESLFDAFNWRHEAAALLGLPIKYASMLFDEERWPPSYREEFYGCDPYDFEATANVAAKLIEEIVSNDEDGTLEWWDDPYEI